MSYTQKLAPMLQWAAQCAEKECIYESRTLAVIFNKVLEYPVNQLNIKDHAERSMRAAHRYKPDTKSFHEHIIHAWAWAIAYVLLFDKEPWPY